ncbi:hypothetical protein KFZ56_05200 [Virgibacillus sp. NKC19-3]|uniref:hypothetical protein n=1 Tax=Virgibacillus saliphilus TaxID=2831674 RepID=UPI001C9A8C3A|nr:hypothetical protein [Virgibacillus sp. NKC19-3]MBY7142484.1 hypothetical protein [Virgibacillus sp. NKC19-3]
MVITSNLMAIGTIVFGFGLGFIIFVMFGGLSKEKRKIYLEEMISQLINLVIFVWVGKIILNFPVFIEDPLTILAYPSDANSFYLAFLFSGLLFFYKSSKWQLDTLLFLESFLLVLLTASLTFEFIQYIWNDNPFAFGYLILLTILLLVFMFMQNRVASGTSILLILTVWSLGVLLLLFIQPFVTVFGYMITPWFLGLVFIIGFSYILYLKRKRRYSWEELKQTQW